jgi:FkbH-like protein
VRLIFTWLDFVVFRDAGRRSASSPAAPPAAARAATGAAAPAEKVKCVAWDLDNTLWRGTLVESAPEELELDPGAAELVRRLDERGILQTIVSKNNHDDAWAVLNKHGLADYFLFPAINWGQKSLNLKQVAEQLNINIDTFAMIDDSDFERAEIAAALPQVRVYPETAIGTLLRRPEFDVTVTELSRQRRLTYLNNIQRDRARETFAGDYEEFLRSCGMRLRLFVPERRGDVERCLELIQRSNQLNLSSRRYAAAEFGALLAREGVLCVALHCADRFGDYGIVGFSSVDEARDEPLVLDFVLSCRVAQKRVEHSYFQWLADRQALRGRRRLRAVFTRTAKNAALFRVFEETPFERVAERDGEQHLELDLTRRVVERPVMRVEADIPERLKAAS